MKVTDAQVETFERDGAVKLPDFAGSEVIAALHDLAAAQLTVPGPWVTDTNPGAETDRLFTSRYLWVGDPRVRTVAFDPAIGRAAAQLLRSTSVRFYFDHLLIKEPATTAPTPWHQDIPYWPFLGHQICSIWIAATAATVHESSLEFVRGSHRWDKYFAPEAFDGQAGWTSDFDGEPCPDIEASRADYDIVGFDVEPGDAIAFSSWILHGARGNAGTHRRVAFSTRWLGDDAVWSPHPGCDPTITAEDVAVEPGAYPADDDYFPLVWPA